MPALRLTLVGRSYCSLCDKMRDACQAAASRDGVDLGLIVVDLDDHPAREAQYGELVPVLLDGPFDGGIEICHYHFDESAWVAARQRHLAAEAANR